MSRINDSTAQKIQNDRPRPPKEGQEALKSSTRQPQDGRKAPQDRPKRAKEPPRAAQDSPKTSQESRPEPSWNSLGAILEPCDQKIEIQTVNSKSLENVGVDLGAQNGTQNDPKTSPKRSQKQDETCITFLSLLDPSWTSLEAILALSWGDL